MKRSLIGLALAGLLVMTGAALAESAPDIPLTAAASPVKLEEIVPLNASEAARPEVAYLPWDMPRIVGRESDGTYLYCVLSAEPELLTGATLERWHDEPFHRIHDDGEAVRMADGRWALRFADREDEVTRLALTFAYSGPGYDEEITMTMHGEALDLLDQELAVALPERRLAYEFDGEGRLTFLSSKGRDESYLASYFSSGEMEGAWVETARGARYTFEGTALQEVWDEQTGITAYYDLDTGWLAAYELWRPSEACPDRWETFCFSCYGTVIWAEAPMGEEGTWEWTPGIGWYARTGGAEKGVFPDASAHLPDPAAMVPPLPAVPLPDYRLDARDISELPPLPVAAGEMPRVTDWQRAGDRLVLTLDGPLLEGFRLRARYDLHLEHAETSIQAADAEAIGGASYAFAVPAGVEMHDLWLEAIRQAADASGFTAVYTRQPLDGPWSVKLTSRAVDIGYAADEEGRVVEAVLDNRLSDLQDEFCRLSFDGETGALTRYDYGVRLPFAAEEMPHLLWWHAEYAITYVPGAGVVSASFGDEEAPYRWTPETGWIAPDGGRTDFLYDPLSFPLRYPFPTEDADGGE